MVSNKETNAYGASKDRRVKNSIQCIVPLKVDTFPGFPQTIAHCLSLCCILDIIERFLKCYNWLEYRETNMSMGERKHGCLQFYQYTKLKNVKATS